MSADTTPKQTESGCLQQKDGEDSEKHTTQEETKVQLKEKCQIWKQDVYCKGFESDDIKVRREGNCICIKGLKEEKRDNSVSVRRFEKRIRMPENIVISEMSCKMSTDGFLYLEAPLDPERSIKPEPVFKALIVPGGAILFTPQQALCFNSNYSMKSTQEKKREGRRQEEHNKDSHSGINAAVEKTDGSGECLEKTGKASLTNDTTRSTDSADSAGAQVVHALNISEQHYACTENETGNEVKEAIPLAYYETDIFLVPEPRNETDKKTTTQATQPEPNIDTSQFAKNRGVEVTQQICAQEGEENVNKTDITSPDTDTKEFVYHLEMPSCDPKSVKVSINDNSRMMTVNAENTMMGESFFIRKSVHKGITIPDDAVLDQVRCIFNEGTLTVMVPLRKSVEKGTIRSIPVLTD